MKTAVENEKLVIFLSGRIDTTNAPQLEAEITALTAQNASLTPVFDADALTYISSAGLRVLLKVAKTLGAEKKLLVREVSPDVFDIFETTGPAYYDLTGIYRDMISAPQNSPEKIEGPVGMKADLILKTGMRFFEKYTALSGEALDAYFKKLGLIYALNVVLTMGAKSASAQNLAPVIMDKLLRGVVIPNEQALRALLAAM